VLHRHRTNSQWSGWEQLWGPGVTNLRAVSWGSDRIDLFARGGGFVGNAVYHRSFSGGIWSPGPEAEWVNITGEFIAGFPPAAVSWGPNRLDVFMVGDIGVANTDNVWHRSWTGREWNPHP